MAFSAITARGSLTEKVSDTSIAMSPSANLTVGKAVFVTCVTDNDSTAVSNGATTRHSLADSKSNTWTKISEYTDTNGAAGDGTTVSLWRTVISTQILTSDTITLTCGSAVTNKIISCFESTIDASSIAVQTVGIGQTAISASVSSLPYREYLLIGAAGSEGNDNSKTPDADYTELFDLRTGSGTAATESAMHVQTRIASLTADTCTSTTWTNTNPIALLAAVYEVYPAASTLTDNFDDDSIDTAKWDVYTEGGAGTALETGGKCQLSPTASVNPSYSTFDSAWTGTDNKRYDLTGSAFFVQVPQVLNAQANNQSWFFARIDDNNYVAFRLDNTTIAAVKNVSGAGDVDVATATYNATTHKWWQIREASGTIYFEYSSTGAPGSWSSLATLANPFAVTGLFVRLNALAYNIASPGTLQFDYFNLTAGTLYTKTLTETVTLSDVLLRTGGKVLADTVTLTASIIRQTGKVISETITYTDVLLKSASRTFSETVTTTDVLFRTGGKVLAETITFTGTLVRATTKVLSETLTMTDTLIRSLARTLTDTVTITDTFSVSRLYSRTLTEVVTLTDTLSKTVGKVISEIVTLTATIARATSRTFSETVTLLDTFILVRFFSRVFSETVTLTDSLVRLTGKMFAETVTMTDSIIRSSGKKLEDTVTLTDALSRSIARAAFTETITMTDTLARSISKVLSEAITFSDSFIHTVAKTLSETVTLQDFFDVYKDIAKSIGTFVLASVYGLMRTIKERPRAFTLGTLKATYTLKAPTEATVNARGERVYIIRLSK